ncbi:type III-A CRISPR-associated protein Csm2 [Succinimonas amylolytica]|uniref:type III-A CRISPR-associated protein Csm2 n=1 Tax=Succinimonas amylolytica TaxID=83769 RepID=UPI0023A8F757
MVYQQNRGSGNGYNNNRSSGGGYSSNRNGGGNSAGVSDAGPAAPYRDLSEDNYVEIAEAAIDALGKHTDRRDNPNVLTTSKIRNILALNTEIYNDILNEPGEDLSDEFKGRINYLRVRIIYEAGREETVKFFVTESHLLEHIKHIQGKRSSYLLFSRYLEALVAFRKFKYKKDE